MKKKKRKKIREIKTLTELKKAKLRMPKLKFKRLTIKLGGQKK